MTNRQIADKLREMAAFYEMEGVQFKPRAYEKAADSVESFDRDLADIYDAEGAEGFRKVPGVGEGIAAHIEQILRRGTFPEYERMKRKYPVDVQSLTSIEGVGPKTVKTLFRKLGVKNLADLEKVAKAGAIGKLPHFGARTQENILKGLDQLLKRPGGRHLLGEVLPLAQRMERDLSRVKGVKHAVVAGSIRRRQETVGDLDILVTTSDPDKVMARFIEFPEVAEVLEHGPTKTTVRLSNGMQADVRVIADNSFGSALQYFTGSKDHNIVVRKMAIAKGLKLNEYGIWRGRKRLASLTEAEVYRVLGLPYIEPELRTASGEIEAALAGRLPKLIPYGSVRGDLQTQSNWTDGTAPIAEMAETARRLGLEYIAATDHTQSLAMVGGLDEKMLAVQGAEIDKLNKKLGGGFRVLKGTECDIKKDGSMDLKDEALARLDLVGASVHSYFRLPRAQQTARIIRAMENPNVDAIFHPTGRVLMRREPSDVDMAKIVKAAKATGTALEIDCYADRMDLNDAHVRLAVGAGVKLIIDSDAHHVSHLGNLDLGVAIARRGWASAKDILNTRRLPELLKWLQTPKKRRK